jgi:MFS transporter, AAHS family, 4-hydroxybenzoate transporter
VTPDRFLQALPTRPWQQLLVGVLVLTLVVDGLDIQLLGLVAPLLLQDLGIARADFGPAMSAALLGMSLGAAGGGWLGDRFGRKALLVASAALFGAATIGVAFAKGVGTIAALRLLGGIGFGAAAPNAVALVGEWLPPRLRGPAVSLLSIGTPLGGLIGSAALIGLLPVLGWRGSFIACGLLSLLIALVALVAVSESPDWLLARGRAAAALSVLRRRLGSAPETLERAQPDAASPVVAVEAGPGARFRIGAWLAFFAVSYVAYAFAAWNPVLLTGAGFPVAAALRASLLFNLLAVAAAIFTGLLVRRFGSRAVMTLAALLLSGAIALMAAALAGIVPAALREAAVGAASALVGATTGTVLAGCYMVIVAAYPVARRSTGLGIGLMVGRAGGIASTYTGGMLLAAGNAGYFGLLAALGVATLAGVAVIDRHLGADARTP